ncbi:MAG: sulfotransferase domain-containing protein [Pseudomonadota bacterium]|nr:sulfotransferase domain-containing protein [Pseudomonadota bacterium]
MTADPRWGEPTPTHDPDVLANFRPRPTDVLITTAPKAGTTWMQQILHQLRSGGDDAFESIGQVVPWLELPRTGRTWKAVLSRYDALPDPRVFKTHCTFEQTPGVGTVRIVMTSRDPRDACVSFYHHIGDMTEAARAHHGLALPESFDAYLDDWLGYGAWYRNVASWWPHRDDPRLLWLRYEDLKRDLPGQMAQILDFLGWSVTDEQFARAVELSSFQWMKANTIRFTRSETGDEPVFKPGGFIRGGRVGDHKTELNEAQARRVLDQARDTLEPECLAFLRIDT